MQLILSRFLGRESPRWASLWTCCPTWSPLDKARTLLFLTGVLAGLSAGVILSWVFGRSRSGDSSGEIRLSEERLLEVDQGLAQFSQQLDVKSSELRMAFCGAGGSERRDRCE